MAGVNFSRTIPLAAERRQICRFFDERQDAARKVRFMHDLLRDNPGIAARYERIAAGGNVALYRRRQ